VSERDQIRNPNPDRKKPRQKFVSGDFPSPRPSPHRMGRGGITPAISTFGASVLAAPSPWGEGWGEGERVLPTPSPASFPIASGNPKPEIQNVMGQNSNVRIWADYVVILPTRSASPIVTRCSWKSASIKAVQDACIPTLIDKICDNKTEESHRVMFLLEAKVGWYFWTCARCNGSRVQAITWSCMRAQLLIACD